MEPSFITTEFAYSVIQVLRTMLQVHGVLASGTVEDIGQPVIGVQALLDGDFQGRLSLAMHPDTASSLARLFTGEPLNACDEDFSDALTELMSIMSGNTKAGMPGCNLRIDRPMLIWGNPSTPAENVDVQSRSLYETVSCGTDCGNIQIGVVLTARRRNVHGAGLTPGATR